MCITRYQIVTKPSTIIKIGFQNKFLELSTISVSTTLLIVTGKNLNSSCKQDFMIILFTARVQFFATYNKWCSSHDFKIVKKSSKIEEFVNINIKKMQINWSRFQLFSFWPGMISNVYHTISYCHKTINNYQNWVSKQVPITLYYFCFYHIAYRNWQKFELEL